MTAIGVSGQTELRFGAPGRRGSRPLEMLAPSVVSPGLRLSPGTQSASLTLLRFPAAVTQRIEVTISNMGRENVWLL